MHAPKTAVVIKQNTHAQQQNKKVWRASGLPLTYQTDPYISCESDNNLHRKMCARTSHPHSDCCHFLPGFPVFSNGNLHIFFLFTRRANTHPISKTIYDIISLFLQPIIMCTTDHRQAPKAGSFYAFDSTSKKNNRENTYPANSEQPQHKRNKPVSAREKSNCLKIGKKLLK